MGVAAPILNSKGQPVAAVHLSPPTSRWTLEEAQRIEREMMSGRLVLLYVAPERFASASFRRLLEEAPIARFAAAMR